MRIYLHADPFPGSLDAVVDGELLWWRIATEKDVIPKAWSAPMTRLSLKIILELKVTGIKIPDSRFLHKRRLSSLLGVLFAVLLAFCIRLSSAIPHMAEKEYLLTPEWEGEVKEYRTEIEWLRKVKRPSTQRCQ
jgi:hypothetical protein